MDSGNFMQLVDKDFEIEKMEKGYYKYYVFTLFILLAIVLFYIGRIATAEIAQAYNEHASPLEQLTGRFIIPFQFLRIYVLLLAVISIMGFYLSRKNTNKGVNKGFVYSIVFSMFLVLAYAGLVIYLFI